MKIVLKKLLLLLLLLGGLHFGVLAQQLSVCSWNVSNMGKSKSYEEVSYMARLLQHYDIIALQEINTALDGAQKVAQLVGLLKRFSGQKWDYRLSPPTTSDNAQEKERYAYIWKTKQVKSKGKPALDAVWQKELVREPFIMQFRHDEKVFALINFHAVPKGKNPERELAFFKQYPQRLLDTPFIILGDFNVRTNNNVFNPLKKMGYMLALQDQKTTLRHKCLPDGCLANDYDNFILHPRQFKVHKSGVVHFYTDFNRDMKKARAISDHTPIAITIDVL